MSRVTVEYQWDRSEYLRVIRKAALPWIYRYQYLLGVFIICVGVILDIEGTGGTSLFIYVIGVAYAVYMFSIMRFATAKSWTKAVGIRGPITVEVTDDDVSTKSDAGDTRLNWAVFPKAKEWSEYYFLMRNRFFVTTIIPKRAFESPADEAIFRNLLRAHTSSKLIPNGPLDGGQESPSVAS